MEFNFPEKKQHDKAEIHIFTGENGTGKSTVLQSLASTYLIPNVRVRLYPYIADKFRFKNSSSVISISNNGGSSEPVNYNFVTDGDFVTNFFSHHLNLGYGQKIKNYPDSKFDFCFFSYSGYRRTNRIKVDSIRELKDNPLENATDFDNSANPQQLVQWIANTKTKEALESIKNGSGNPGRYRKAIERIEQTVSEIIEKPVKFVMETDPLAVSVEIDNQQISLDALPDGLKSIISWIADLLMRMDRIKWATDEEVFDRNFILFLDEIEVHLHPAWQRKILPVVQKLFKNAQIFISTHSPFVVGSVDDAWVYKLENVDGNARLADGFPVLSSSGKSYQLVLDEIFGIGSEFSETLEKELQEFYHLREELLHKDFHQETQFIEKAKQLAGKSPEVRDIVGREIRQLNRLLKKEYAL